jgi:hypothetical protein
MMVAEEIRRGCIENIRIDNKKNTQLMGIQGIICQDPIVSKCNQITCRHLLVYLYQFVFSLIYPWTGWFRNETGCIFFNPSMDGLV